MGKVIKKFKAVNNNKYLQNPFIRTLIWAFIYNLFIETLARQSMPGYGGLYYMVHKPLVFLANMLIIYATLSFSAFFKRQSFVFVCVSIFWLAVGITNGVILTTRMTPFTVKDFDNLQDGFTIIAQYFNKFQIALMLLAIVGGFALLFLYLMKGKKRPRPNFKKTLATWLIVLAVTFGSVFGLVKVGTLGTFFSNLAYAYQDYGVPYCFINTWINHGIKKPAGYSEEAVKSLFSESDYDENGNMSLTQNNSANEEDMPNIIFLQLESFTDPTLFKNITLSEDPIPNLRKLWSEYSSGSFTAPACGAGTANIEFEVMTGLSVKFFGPGEYPFKTVLKKKTVENLAYDLGSLGYSTHAIHNHRAVFYNRSTVFANMGYDTFTSVEYMSDVVRTPKNWAKDEILVGEIQKALDSSEGRDYIYTISVQGHGQYPSEQVLTDPDIKVTSAPDEATKNKYEYYVNQVHEMDQFVADLIKMLEERDEPTVLVMYGDHIPALDITEENYGGSDLYQTQYCIWDNIGLTKKDENLSAYEIAAEVLDRLGIHTGTIVKYNQEADHNSESYLTGLKMLAYDMLYGKQYIYGGTNPFKPSSMKMGVEDITIDSVVRVGGKYYIKGKNFTECSRITLNGKILNTTYLNSSLLYLKDEVDPADASKMTVSQIDTKTDTILSTVE